MQASFNCRTRLLSKSHRSRLLGVTDMLSTGNRISINPGKYNNFIPSMTAQYPYSAYKKLFFHLACSITRWLLEPSPSKALSRHSAESRCLIIMNL
jgi:hypothetical protein